MEPVATAWQNTAETTIGPLLWLLYVTSRNTTPNRKSCFRKQERKWKWAELILKNTKFSDFVFSVPWFRGSAISCHISFHTVKYKAYFLSTEAVIAFSVGIRSTETLN